jgi:hypothetical protein
MISRRGNDVAAGHLCGARLVEEVVPEPVRTTPVVREERLDVASRLWPYQREGPWIPKW